MDALRDQGIASDTDTKARFIIAHWAKVSFSATPDDRLLRRILAKGKTRPTRPYIGRSPRHDLLEPDPERLHQRRDTGTHHV